MKTGRMVMVVEDKHSKTWRVYSPTYGDDIATSMPTREHAESAVRSLGFELIGREDLVEGEHVDLQGYAYYNHLSWWIENCDLPSVRKNFADLMLYEAHIMRIESDRTQDSTGHDLMRYESMSIVLGSALEELASDFNQWAPAYAWCNLARWKVEKAKEAVVERITTAMGTAELV